MTTTQINAYFLECVTNMHVGSGDANYGVVDKLVQRDPVTGFPTIHSSSLKGALREHFETVREQNNAEIIGIFGREISKDADSSSGEFKFFGADLVSLPVRSNFKQFSLALSPELIRQTNHKTKLLTGKEIFNESELVDSLFCKEMPSYDVYLEDEILSKKPYSPILKSSGIKGLNERYAIVDNNKFSSFTKSLPVIARNQLDKGISNNLWYEEVVPHQTLFITFIATSSKYDKFFDEVILSEGATIQIGGNASIGYGICKFHKISFS